MNIKNYLASAVLIISLSNSAFAQLFIIDNCNPLITSLNSVAHVIRQDYLLLDENGKEFGKDGNEYFGFGYGPAIVINNELVYSPNTYKPFLNDSSYKSFGENYSPASSNVHYKLLADETYTDVPTESIIVNNTYYAVKLPDKESITKSRYDKEKNTDCLVITYLANDKSISDKTTFKMSYLASKVKWQDDNTGRLTNSNLGSSAVFGLLFYQVVGIGEASLEFGGFVEKINNEWVCLPYAKKVGLTPNVVEEEESTKNSSKKKRGKKKKP